MTLYARMPCNGDAGIVADDGLIGGRGGLKEEVARSAILMLIGVAQQAILFRRYSWHRHRLSSSKRHLIKARSYCHDGVLSFMAGVLMAHRYELDRVIHALMIAPSSARQ